MTSRRSKGSTSDLGAALVLTVLLCSETVLGVTSACTANSGIDLLQLNRRDASRLLLSEQRPAYPPLARINYINGNVSLLLTINCAGRVQQVHVMQGHPFLAMAALQAIRKWIYHPFITASGPAAFQTTVKVDFSLLSPSFKYFPPQPEKFLERNVRPPQLSKEAKIKGAKNRVRVRVLVSDQGRVVDASLVSGNPSQFEEAKQIVTAWKFKPARWGNLNVPWYAEVDVPVGGDSLAQAKEGQK